MTDYLAIALFLAFWLGYGFVLRLLFSTAIDKDMQRVRKAWMLSMLKRDSRIMDAQLVGHVTQSATFFASTSLIAIGGLIGVLASLDRLMPSIEALSFVSQVSRPMFEAKIALPAAVLIHGLIKHIWSIRQMNYLIGLIGAAPPAPLPEAQQRALADQIGGVMSWALSTYNEGLRSYYFALAALCWLAGPVTLMIGVVLLVAMLLHRQRGSGVSHHVHAALLLIETSHGGPVTHTRDAAMLDEPTSEN